MPPLPPLPSSPPQLQKPGRGSAGPVLFSVLFSISEFNVFVSETEIKTPCIFGKGDKRGAFVGGACLQQQQGNEKGSRGETTRAAVWFNFAAPLPKMQHASSFPVLTSTIFALT